MGQAPSTEVLADEHVAGSWVLAALATGVLGDERYDRGKLLLTWAAAAPVAALLRLFFFDDPLWLEHAAVGAPASVVTDAVATLLLQNALRIAEEQGYV